MNQRMVDTSLPIAGTFFVVLMKYPQLPVFAFLTAALVLVPLPWHWRARNVATLAIIFWLFIIDVIYGVNALIWAGNVRNPVPVWCDITTKIIVGASYALPLATLCICKHLEMVASSRKASYDVSDRHRRMIFESVMCFGIPMIFMALHYVVQGHRYDIFEDFGCQATVYISVPAIMIIWFPPLLFSTIAFIYAVLSLHHFIQRRLIFAAHLQNSNSALTTNRYLRLIAMSVTQMTWGTVLTSYNLYNNAFPGLRPWISWADVHSNFSRVDIYSAAGVPAYFIQAMLLFWWTMPASSIIFFLFFGFGEEAKKEYNKIWGWFQRTILRKKSEKGSLMSNKLLPTSAPRPLHLLELKKNGSSSSSTHKPLGTSYSTTSSYPSTITISAPIPLKTSKSFEARDSSETQINTHTDANTDTDDHDHDSTDTFTISSFSYYAQSTLAGSTPAHSPTTPTVPRINISSAFSSSRAPSPVPSVPESVGPESYTHTNLSGIPEEVLISTGTRGTPAYHRPFSPPNFYPIAQPYMSNNNLHELPQLLVPPPNGILVTIHRQASVDKMV